MFCLSLRLLPQQTRTEGHWEVPEGRVSGKRWSRASHCPGRRKQPTSNGQVAQSSQTSATPWHANVDRTWDRLAWKVLGAWLGALPSSGGISFYLCGLFGGVDLTYNLGYDSPRPASAGCSCLSTPVCTPRQCRMGLDAAPAQDTCKD